jgi:MatE
MTAPEELEEDSSLQSVVNAEYDGRSSLSHRSQSDDMTYLDTGKIIDEDSLRAPNRKMEEGFVPLAIVDSLGPNEEAVALPAVKHSYRAEVMAQIQLAFPVCCTFVLRKSVDIVSLIYVGHLKSNYLSAAGIAAVTSNVTGNSMVIGLAGALSTICSQAYGSKDYRTFSVAPQRAVLILGLFICTPISFLWWYSEPVMIALGQVCRPSVCLSLRLFCDVYELCLKLTINCRIKFSKFVYSL